MRRCHSPPCECGCGVARGATIDTINASVALGVSAAEPVVFALAGEDNATSVWSGVSCDDAVDAADVDTDEHSTSGAIPRKSLRILEGSPGIPCGSLGGP